MWHRTRVFDDLFDVLRDVRSQTAVTPRQTSEAGTWSFVPAVEWLTRGKQLVLRAELPGVDPEQVEVIVEGRQLTLRGEKRSAHESEPDAKVYYRELVHGRFERTFTLPEGIKADQVKAVFTQGVLEITMPAEGFVPATSKVTVQVDDGGSRKRIQAA
jgi:HSP20 family protein